MSKKQIYVTLVEGARNGLSGQPLYDFVTHRCKKATSKKLVRAALLALSDPELRDRTVLATIYALAIQHRLDAPEVNDYETDGDDGDDLSPLTSLLIAEHAMHA